MTGRTIGTLILAALLSGGLSAYAQELPEIEAEVADQILVDLDALIIGTSATLRCSIYSDDLPYLSPLDATGAEIRIRQLESVLAPAYENLADTISTMRAEAAAVPCGNPGLLPFLEFSRDAGEDIVDIGIFAWQSIRFDTCSYFADNQFLEAVAHAQELAAGFSVDGDAARVAYISENAQMWSAVFEENCFNPTFDPTQTLPGLIALALPTD